ncbi:MAG: NYN domain-containing protein, partial [Anaerolineae bacterium]|nr:NYN domain-containing protein [Anaerolineae bacterium]
MKSALFVDFDNVFSGLRRFDPACADIFARNPARWMEWLVNALDLPDYAPSEAKRRVLVRRCYLNPQAYQRFRPSFNLAGFEIVDCPALTGEGKTSTDIHMVLDIVDLLQHEARYDEFIVFSADADFTPVLRKLRRWDRRTTVLAIGFPSAAYRASADLLIDQDNFVRNALGFDDESEVKPVPPSAKPQEEIASEAFKLMRQAVTESKEPVPLSRLASLVLSKIEGMDASSWAGFGSFRAFLESRGLSPLEVCWEGGGTVRDLVRHSTALPAKAQNGASSVDVVEAAARIVRNATGKTLQPIQCGSIANLIIRSFPQLAADWNGNGTFRKFTETLDVRPAVFDWTTSGGTVFNPTKTSSAGTPDEWKSDHTLYALAKQIHEVTGMPLLPPLKYRTLLGLVEADVAAHPFHLMETGKRVRDMSREVGSPISRAD